MGKSSKKSTPKVDPAPALSPASKPSKKGKREAKEALEKVENVKKQKKDDKDVAKVIEKKVEVKTQKKKKEESSSSSSDDSSSEEEQKVKAVTKKAVKPPAKESSSEEESSSSDEEPPTKKTALPPKKVKEPVKNGSVKAKKDEGSSSSESSDSSSEDESDEDKEPKNNKIQPAVNGVQMEDSIDSSDSDSDDEAPVKAAVPKNAPAVTAKNKSESSETSDDSESDDSSDDEDNSAKASVPTKTPAQAAKEQNQKSDSSEGSSDDSDSSDEDEAPAPKSIPAPTVTKKDDSESDESSDEDSDSEEDNEKTKKATLVAPKVQQSKNSNESSSESDSDESDEEDDDNDVEMVDAETPKKASGQADLKSASKTSKTPTASGTQTGGSKTLFMGNLPYDVERADIENFFKDVAEVVDIRLALDPEQRFKGFGHVEFGTAEDAQKALQLDGQNLSGRRIRLDLARERGAPGSYTPSSGKDNTFQKGGRGQVQKIFVRGFDKSLPEEEIRNALSVHFETCGEIGRISIPTDYETGAIKGMAYIEFKDADAFSNALGLNDSQMGEDYLTVEEARPRPSDGRDGGWSGGRSGGRGSGGRGFDSRSGGGWGRRGRGDGGRGFGGG